MAQPASNSCCRPCPSVWWVSSDPCGLFSANFTIVLLLYAWTVMIKVIIVPWFGWGVHAFAFSFIIIAALASHSRCQYTEPGCIPVKFSANVSPASLPHVSEETVRDEDFRKLRICRRCETVKPPGSHHCSSCARCVMKMDHHCPWVNNCVAVFNQKYFINFLMWTCSSCIYAGILLVTRFVQCSGMRRRRFQMAATTTQCDIGDAGVALSIITFIEALIFGLFTGIMMFDQISAILDGTSAIDAMQGNKGEKKPKMEALREVFGEPFSLRWFLPFTIKKEMFDRFDRDLRLAEATRRYAVKKLKEKERRQAERDAELKLRERNAVSHAHDNINGHDADAGNAVDGSSNGTSTAPGDPNSGYKDLNN